MITMGKKMNRYAAVLLLSGILYTTTVKSNINTSGPGDPPAKAVWPAGLPLPINSLICKTAAQADFQERGKERLSCHRHQ